MSFKITQDNKLQHSKLIASLLGPVLVAVTVTEAINLRIWETSIPQVVFLNGMIFFVIGLAVVRFHNLWRRSWVVAITIAGWMLLLAGLFRMVFPNTQQLNEGLATYMFIAGLTVFGLFLSFKAYR